MEARDVEKTYLYVNKRCSSVAGVWPFASRRKMWIRRTTVLVVVVTSIASQIASVKMNLSTDAIIEQCPFLVIAIGTILKELNYVIHEEELRKILESLLDDWLTKRPKSEMEILDKYARRGLFFNRLYVVNGIFCYVIFTTVAITPRVLDLVSPINGSRGVGFIYPAYYGLDEEEHYYILMGHMLCVITVVFFVFIAADSIYMTAVQHACGLLGISGYRFKWAIQENNENDKNHNVKLEQAYRKVCHSIRAHQHAVNYIMRIESLHTTYLFMLVALVMLSLSVTLVKTSTMDPCMDFYKYCGFLVVQLIHLLFLAIQGHFVIISYDKAYNNIYDAVWYNASPKTQILYMLALRKNLTPPMLTAGGLIALNLETFAEILKASVSWVTVMKSA